jgi:hypothetical protein
MKVSIDMPKAFSVREENEFYPIRHLMARLNPKLMVTQVATGIHVKGTHSVFWGVVYHEDKFPSRKDVEAALRDAGYDFTRNPPI